MAETAFNEYNAYTKMVARLVLCGTKVLRELLLNYLSNSAQSIDSFLSSKKGALLKCPTGKTNEATLFPVNKTPSNIHKWDISLLLHVLLNVCPNLQQSLLSHLRDLRELRNNLFHSANATLCERNFDKNWQKMDDITSEIFAVLKDNQLLAEVEKDVSSIKSGNLTEGSATECQKLLSQWYYLDCFEQIKEG